VLAKDERGEQDDDDRLESPSKTDMLAVIVVRPMRPSA
jgi:hypothetical protein